MKEKQAIYTALLKMIEPYEFSDVFTEGMTVKELDEQIVDLMDRF